MSLNQKWIDLQTQMDLMYVNLLTKALDQQVDNLTALKSRPAIEVKTNYVDLDTSIDKILIQCRLAIMNTKVQLLATEATLLLIKTKTDNLDVLLSTRNVEATQLLIKAKTDNLDVLLSTRLAEATFTTRINTQGQKAMAASTPVVIASDQTKVLVSPETATTIATATGVVNAGSTISLAAVASQFHYICYIELVKLYSVVGVAAGAGVIITTTNLVGNPSFTTEQLASPAGTATKVIQITPARPLKSSVVNTATTFIAPAQLQTIWRWTVVYYTAT